MFGWDTIVDMCSAQLKEVYFILSSSHSLFLFIHSKLIIRLCLCLLPPFPTFHLLAPYYPSPIVPHSRRNQDLLHLPVGSIRFHEFLKALCWSDLHWKSETWRGEKRLKKRGNREERRNPFSGAAVLVSGEGSSGCAFIWSRKELYCSLWLTQGSRKWLLLTGSPEFKAFWSGVGPLRSFVALQLPLILE